MGTTSRSTLPEVAGRTRIHMVAAPVEAAHKPEEEEEHRCIAQAEQVAVADHSYSRVEVEEAEEAAAPDSDAAALLSKLPHGEACRPDRVKYSWFL